MKNLGQILENQDIITKQYLVAGYEPLLPATPLEPGTKYLNGNRQWSTLDADLTAIAGLTGTSGLLRKTAANTWTLDNTTALGDMTIAVYGGSASGIVAKSDALKETRVGATEKVWVGTKAQYDAIVTKDPETCYITTDETYGSYISLDGTGHILASYMPLTVSDHIASTSNPHGVTKTQIGLQYVNNTSDLDKPISAATQNALNSKSNLGHIHLINGTTYNAIAFLDFGVLEDTATTIVTGQTWVTASSPIVLTLLGEDNPPFRSPEDGVIEQITLSVSSLIPGVGFTITAHAPEGATGIYKVIYIGG